MTYLKEEFRARYRSDIGTVPSSNCYVSYLNLVDDLVQGLDEHLAAHGPDQIRERLIAMPKQAFSKARSRSNCVSALAAYIRFTGRS